MEPGTGHHTAVSMANVLNSMQQQGTTLMSTSSGTLQGATLSLSSMDSYEDVFKEITKKLYGDEALAEAIDGAAAGQTQTANIIYEADPFRGDVNGLAGALNASGLTLVTTGPNGLPPGTIVVQRRIHQDEKGRLWASVDMPQGSGGEQMTLTTVGASSPEQIGIESPSPVPTIEERWFESEEVLSWTTSKIARYNPSQKVFRCVDCDFVGFLSRVAEHWLGNHASLRVFQCPRCPYTSAWARCVRMHLTRQHGETLQDNSLWKENPVLEEYKTQVTKFLTGLKTKVETKGETNLSGERRYTCPYCPYATDRRDLYNRHENIHRDEKPFQCYVCDKQFNRADHVKKHFTRMHRDSPYDIHKIKKHFPKNQGGVVSYQNSKMAAKQQQHHQQQQQQQELAEREEQIIQDLEAAASAASSGQTISLQLQGTSETVTVQQIPHIAYFNPPSTPGQTGPLQGIVGVGGTKKENKSKGVKKKKSGEKMYTCSYCPWQGVDNWCLKRHLNTHIKPFLCALCDYKAARSERLATHVIKVHNKRVCHKCSFLADDTESLGQHVQDSHQNPLVKTGFNCNVCQEYFELRADLEAHAILEHQKVIVQCDLCDFRTTDELSMEAHLREKHNLQPGMGAVAAAAAAAAAAAIGQPTTTHYQMHLQTQPQIQITADQMQVIGQIAADQQQQQLNLMPEQQNQSNLSSTVAAVAAGSDYNQDPLGGLLPKVEPGLLEMEQEESTLIEPEPEPETLCEKCGIEFADEQSLKLHEKRHEVEASILKETTNPLGSKAIKKIIIRSYVCSTCSYTAATKKLMMQHQRAHNGLELVCKAEFCLFTSPFENTMKEHISSEHGTESNVRCPHCGLRMPSSSAFTYHCRLHHKSICSLCVNLYRIRYEIKENDLHELVSRSDLDLVNDELEARDKPLSKDPLQVETVEEPPSAELQTDANSNAAAGGRTILTTTELDQAEIHSISQAETTQLISQHSVDPLAQEIQGLSAVADQVIEEEAEEITGDLKPLSIISNNNNNNEDEYPSAVDFTSSRVCPVDEEGSEEPPRKRARLEFFPVPQAVARVRQRESWRILPTFSEVLVTPVISEAILKPSYHTIIGSKTNKSIPRYLSKFCRNKGYNPAGPLRLHPFRRYLTRGTTSWLRRNGVKGFRCHSLLCAERGGWRYPRKSGYLLHTLWHHSRPLYSCDCCEGRFPHLYQAILHKLKVHPQQSDQLLISQESYLQQHHIQMSNHQQGPPPTSSTTTLQFHQQLTHNSNSQLELQQLAQFSHNNRSLLNS